MPALQKFNAFVEHLAEGVHNLQTGALKSDILSQEK